MDQQFRGGNSRLLARLLDNDVAPFVVLDAKGTIVFANSSLCAAAQLDATVLVGKKCSWSVPDDHSVAPALLAALAPPEGVRAGRISMRHLTTPPIYGTDISGELFIPLLGDDGSPQLFLVLLGQWKWIRELVAGLQNDMPQSATQTRRDDETLVANIRAQWPALNALHALIGESDAAQAAMRRAQAAISSDCGVFLSGPSGVGKLEIARAIFNGRLVRGNSTGVDGVFFPIQCDVLSSTEIANMLDVFAGRLKQDVSPATQNLALLSASSLDTAALDLVSQWYRRSAAPCSITVTVVQGKALPADEQRLRELTELEISLPALRDRREDVGPLIRQEIATFVSRDDKMPLKIAPEAMELLVGYDWPGNLVDLRSAVAEIVESLTSESAASAAGTPNTVKPENLPVAIRTFPSSALSAGLEKVEAISLDEVLLDVEKEMIQRALKLSPRNRAAAARMLGISRPRLLRRIEQLGIE